MRYGILVAATVLMAAGAAGAATHRVSDLDYLNARRCQGLADGLHATGEAVRLGAFTEAQGRMRISVIKDMGWDEYRRARRQAADPAQAAPRRAELADRCAAIAPSGEEAAR